MKISTNVVADYWDKNTKAFTVFATTRFHCGYWEEDTKSRSEAHRNMNKYVADLLEIDKYDFVLDTGCGIGEVSNYIAEKYEAHVTGISISRHQIAIANENKLLSEVPHLLSFFQQNYLHTEFDDESFSKIFGLESVCYASDKNKFLSEAYRLLKSGGKIVVVDAFLNSQQMNNRENKMMTNFLSGWGLSNLSSLRLFSENMMNLGFRNIEFYDLGKKIMKTVSSASTGSVLAYPLTWLLSKTKLIPKSYHKILQATINQKRLLDREIIAYGTFSATK